jgi:hypothetical protein
MIRTISRRVARRAFTCSARTNVRSLGSTQPQLQLIHRLGSTRVNYIEMSVEPIPVVFPSPDNTRRAGIKHNDSL